MEIIVKRKKVYVLAALNDDGTFYYLRSLHEPGRWEIVNDIEVATKYTSKYAAEMSYDFYQMEMLDNINSFTMLPTEIAYTISMP